MIEFVSQPVEPFDFRDVVVADLFRSMLVNCIQQPGETFTDLLKLLPAEPDSECAGLNLAIDVYR